MTKGDEIRRKVAELRERGLMWKEIEMELKMTRGAVGCYARQLRKEKAKAASQNTVTASVGT